MEQETLIVANGCPKSGTHALCALLDTFGLKRCPGTILGCYQQELHIAGTDLTIGLARSLPDNVYILAHVSSGHDMSGFRMLTIKRDPRNVLVSYCRHRKCDNLIYDIPQALVDFWGAPFIATYRSFLGWAGRAVLLRYEDMPPSVVGDGSGIYARHGRDWNTRTGSPSRWQAVWDQSCELAWIEHGGPELLEEAGYST